MFVCIIKVKLDVSSVGSDPPAHVCRVKPAFDIGVTQILAKLVLSLAKDLVSLDNHVKQAWEDKYVEYHEAADEGDEHNWARAMIREFNPLQVVKG